ADGEAGDQGIELLGAAGAADQVKVVAAVGTAAFGEPPDDARGEDVVLVAVVGEAGLLDHRRLQAGNGAVADDGGDLDGIGQDGAHGARRRGRSAHRVSKAARAWRAAASSGRSRSRRWTSAASWSKVPDTQPLKVSCGDTARMPDAGWRTMGSP